MSELLPRSVLIMAGGTGGHVFPALAAAASLQEKGVNVEWLGTRRGIESRLVPAAEIPINFINISGLRGKNPFQMLKALLQVITASIQVFRILYRLKPVCVLGMGGFVSGPGGLVAWLTGKPLVIHEQNAVAGIANRLLSRIANKVLQGYPIDLGGNKGEYIGNPVRGEIVRLPAPEQRGVGRSGNFRLLVVGGSLGAKPINELLPQAIALMPLEKRPVITHQAGEMHAESVRELYQSLNVEARVMPFIDDMAKAYSEADLVVCRAGALTIAELTAAGVASILVPLPYAIDDHQTANAKWLVDNQAGILMPQKDLTAQSLAEQLQILDSDREKLLAYANAARALARIDAADRVANICLEVANG